MTYINNFLINMNIKTIALTVISLAVFASCNQKQAKESPAQKVEVKTVQPEYLLNDSIKKLIANKVIVRNTQAGTKYTLENKELGGITFQEASLNYYEEQSEIVRSISYGSVVSNKEMNTLYTQMLSFLKDKYGEPVRDIQSISKDKTAKYTRTLWDNGEYAISLSATVPIYEKNGGLVVVITIPEDINKFPTFFQ